MNLEPQKFIIGLMEPFSTLLPWLARTLIWPVFKRERNHAVNRAGRIKQQALGALQAKDAINNFQWRKAWLNAESPTSCFIDRIIHNL